MNLAIENLKEKILYKFRCIEKNSSDPEKPNEKKLHYIERIFSHNELYFPNPVNLNDPLECRPLITVRDLSDLSYKEKYINYAKKLMVKGGNQEDPNILASWLATHSQQNAEQFCSEQTEQYRQALKSYRICSFSESNNNPLVWSHYADSHQGFSLIFDANNDLFGSALKVEYQEKYPELDFTEEDDYEILKNSALVKFTDWAYEKEYRLVSREPNFNDSLPVKNNKWIFPDNMLIGVIFGYKMSIPDKELIIKFSQKYSKRLNFKEAILHNNHFNLKIIDAK